MCDYIQTASDSINDVGNKTNKGIFAASLGESNFMFKLE